ncbi:MAG TPA: cyanophycin synthetase, partial [Flavitalea sp.]|nr:cyanophycin synthetase [Flavitalea sp.]
RIIKDIARNLDAEHIDATTTYETNTVEIPETNLIDLSLTNRKLNSTTHYRLDLPGLYQQYNLPVVLSACDWLVDKGWKLPADQIKTALKQVMTLTGFAGRFEVLSDHPKIVLDVAHNQDGMQELIRQFPFHQDKLKKLFIIIGMVKDKEIDAVLSMLPKKAIYYFTKAQIPRALPEQLLAERASSHGLHGVPFSDVNSALVHALATACANDIILVCGSVFVVGEVNRELIASHKNISKATPEVRSI